MVQAEQGGLRNAEQAEKGGVGVQEGALEVHDEGGNGGEGKDVVDPSVYGC